MDILHFENITNFNHPDWEKVWMIYETSFPKNEKRSLDAQKLIHGHPRYHWYNWYLKNELIGFTAWWEYERFSFLEHFAVSSAKRSGGFGKTILTTWMQQPHPVVVLEIDPIKDEISTRRWKFYERLGFLENGIEHSHPSYFDGSSIVPLLVLSHPRKITQELYEEFARLEIEEMLPHLK